VAAAVAERRVVWRLHALERMLKRSISRADVFSVLADGEMIEEYENDAPFPSALFMGWVGKRPVHVVAALDATQTLYVITAYEPDTEHFEGDFRRRRN